jgi:type I restriction enzyme R subunit
MVVRLPVDKLAGYAKIRLNDQQGDVLAPQPEQQARGNIDVLLEAAGWHVCDASAANIHAARGIAIREFPLPGYGFADYLLYVDGKAGVIAAKKEGATLTGVESQSDKYTKGLPAGLPRSTNPMPSFHC